MITVKVTNTDQVTSALRAIPADMRDKALGPALNKVAQKASAEVTRAITDEYAVKANEVRNAVQVRKATSRRLEARIDIFGSAKRRGRSLNLIHFLAAYQAAGRAFKTRGSKGSQKDLKALAGQLGFLIRKAGGLKKIDGAFVGNKGRTVFRRTGKERLPIEPLQVIGFSQMFSSRRISQRVMAKIDADLPIEVDRAIARLLGGKGS